MNLILRLIVCSWKGHDLCQPYCFRCWKYFDPAEYEWSE